MVGLLTLYDVLRFVFRGVMHVAFETHVGNNFLNDYAANPTCFGVPFNMVTELERLSHRAATILSESHVVIQARKKSPSARGICQSCQIPEAISLLPVLDGEPSDLVVPIVPCTNRTFLSLRPHAPFSSCPASLVGLGCCSQVAHVGRVRDRGGSLP